MKFKMRFDPDICCVKRETLEKMGVKVDVIEKDDYWGENCIVTFDSVEQIEKIIEETNCDFIMEGQGCAMFFNGYYE